MDGHGAAVGRSRRLRAGSDVAGDRLLGRRGARELGLGGDTSGSEMARALPHDDGAAG